MRGVSHSPLQRRGQRTRGGGGYSLIGKTAILHIVILGSSPNISRWIKYNTIKYNATKYNKIIFNLKNSFMLLYKRNKSTMSINERDNKLIN